MKIKITSLSFSKNETLKNELFQIFPDAILNEAGHSLSQTELIEFLKDAQGVIVGIDKFDREVINALPNLQIISKFGVGLDNIDIEFAKSRGITIGWTGGVNRRSVAEQTLAFMVGLCRNLFATGFELKQGTWNKNGGFQLSGKTVGIVGCGNIGTEVLKLLQPFECRLLICDILDKSQDARNYGACQVELDELLSSSDVISLHVPLTPQTHNLINTPHFSQIKPSAFLINTSRGPVVNQSALKYALVNHLIAGAALDVFEEEPPTDLELLTLSNLVATPHIGGNAIEAIEAMGLEAIQHLKIFFEKNS